MRINLNGEEETVRLLLVDTPETVHPTIPEQPYGVEASTFAKETLSIGKQIQLEYDGLQRDYYDRMIGYIWVDGKMFNKMLLAEGLARCAY
ncbi:thermonuclease family protein [Gracilibacillus sp. YIM 98692]|uniref:thermonuclease family protein n=1 Tax=Gracilibacillus sp. YIM 98692 TaxID=2663532 RepID=UPI0013D17A4C|nr:thermonuclease family protein [Gracilibacillus sp. YIM 98692]